MKRAYLKSADLRLPELIPDGRQKDHVWYIFNCENFCHKMEFCFSTVANQFLTFHSFRQRDSISDRNSLAIFLSINGIKLAQYY